MRVRNRRKLNSLLLLTSNPNKIIPIRSKVAAIEKSLKGNYDSWRLNKETEACDMIKKNPNLILKDYLYCYEKRNILDEKLKEIEFVMFFGPI